MSDDKTPTPEEQVKTRLDEIETGYKAELEERDAKIEALETEAAQFRKDIKELAAKPVVPAEPKREFDLDRLMYGLVTGDFSGAERELEVCNGEEAEQLRKTSWAQRDQTIGTDSQGGYLVPSQYLPDRFIDKVENALILPKLGVTMLSGLTKSPVCIPKLTTNATAYWVAEGGSITESTLAFGEVTLEPVECAALVELTNRAIRYTDPAVMPIVTDSMADAIARAIDLEALTGDASANTPRGIRNMADVQSI